MAEEHRTETAEHAWAEVEPGTKAPRPRRPAPTPAQQAIAFVERGTAALGVELPAHAAPVGKPRTPAPPKVKAEPKPRAKRAPAAAPPPERRTPEERSARADAAALQAARVEGRREALERATGTLERHGQALATEHARRVDDAASPEEGEKLTRHGAGVQRGLELARADITNMLGAPACELPHPGGHPVFRQTAEQLAAELRTAQGAGMMLEACMSRVARLARAEVVRLLRAEGYAEAALVVEGDGSAFGDVDESTSYSKAPLNQALWRVEGGS